VILNNINHLKKGICTWIDFLFLELLRIILLLLRNYPCHKPYYEQIFIIAEKRQIRKIGIEVLGYSITLQSKIDIRLLESLPGKIFGRILGAVNHQS
jgi:hypothetical protein